MTSEKYWNCECEKRNLDQISSSNCAPNQRLSLYQINQLVSFSEGSPRKIVITTNVSCNAAILGDSVAIRCWSRGYPAPLCGIYRDGNLLSANRGVYVIENFTSLDQGVYICNCSNVAGAAQANFSLTLYGKWVCDYILVLEPTSGRIVDFKWDIVVW